MTNSGKQNTSAKEETKKCSFSLAIDTDATKEEQIENLCDALYSSVSASGIPHIIDGPLAIRFGVRFHLNPIFKLLETCQPLLEVMNEKDILFCFVAVEERICKNNTGTVEDGKHKD